MVELKPLRKRQREQHAPRPRERSRRIYQLGSVASQSRDKFRRLVLPRHDDGSELLVARARLAHGLSYGIRPGVLVLENLDAGRRTLALHGRHLHALAFGQKAREQVGDAGGGAVARHEMALAHLAAQALKRAFDLRERESTLANRLVLVAEQHEVGAGEEPGENGELGNRVVLHLVDHDVARVGVRKPRARDLQVEPRCGR